MKIIICLFFSSTIAFGQSSNDNEQFYKKLITSNESTNTSRAGLQFNKEYSKEYLSSSSRLLNFIKREIDISKRLEKSEFKNDNIDSNTSVLVENENEYSLDLKKTDLFTYDIPSSKNSSEFAKVYQIAGIRCVEIRNNFSLKNLLSKSNVVCTVNKVGNSPMYNSDQTTSKIINKIKSELTGMNLNCTNGVCETQQKFPDISELADNQKCSVFKGCRYYYLGEASQENLKVISCSHGDYVTSSYKRKVNKSVNLISSETLAIPEELTEGKSQFSCKNSKCNVFADININKLLKPKLNDGLDFDKMFPGGISQAISRTVEENQEPDEVNPPRHPDQVILPYYPGSKDPKHQRVGPHKVVDLSKLYCRNPDLVFHKYIAIKNAEIYKYRSNINDSRDHSGGDKSFPKLLKENYKKNKVNQN